MIAPDLFPDAPKARQMFPSGTIVRGALIEDNYRWWLTRAWGPGPSIAIIGLNPSDANAERDDPTMLREIGFAFRWGYGSLIKFNLYPFISSSPAAMKRWRSGRNADHSARDAFIRNAEDAALRIESVETVWGAWGNGAEQDDLEYFFSALADTKCKGRSIYCLGTNADGSPKHTLARGTHRIPDDATLQVWGQIG